ncbi:hypothetical protein BC834DRAFT_667691 [Gloeopeniophorella convolvens]|nr:hypothetical protein BC834DRAFT_667691 [Gloeopeniophorella convolvens]
MRSCGESCAILGEDGLGKRRGSSASTLNCKERTCLHTRIKVPCRWRSRSPFASSQILPAPTAPQTPASESMSRIFPSRLLDAPNQYGPDEDLNDKTVDWKEAYIRLKSQRDDYRNQLMVTTAQRDRSETFSVLIGHEFSQWQERTYKKRNKGRSRMFSVASGAARRQLAAERREHRKEKGEKEDVRKERRTPEAAMAAALRVEKGQTGIAFPNRKLNTQKLQDLRNIAWSLGLGEEGGRAALAKRIRSHLLLPENRPLRTSPRVSFLLTKKELSIDVVPIPSTSTSTPHASRSLESRFAPA